MAKSSKFLRADCLINIFSASHVNTSRVDRPKFSRSRAQLRTCSNLSCVDAIVLRTRREMAASRGNEFIMRSCHTYFPCLPLPSPSVRPSGRLQSTLSIPRAHHRTMQSEKEDGLPAMRSSASREFDRIRGNASVRARCTRARGCKRRWNTVTERIHRVALRRERKRRTGEEEREMKRMNNGKSGARGRERER